LLLAVCEFGSDVVTVWIHERCSGGVDLDLCLFVDWGTVVSFWLNFMRFSGWKNCCLVAFAGSNL